MKKLFLAIAAAALIPGAAFAQPAAAVRQDAREIRQDQREIARDRAELRQDQRELRADVRDARHRPVVQPRIVVGTRLNAAAYGTRYQIAKIYRYRLAKPGYNQRWVRIHDDAVLVNVRTGRVVKVVYNIFR